MQWIYWCGNELALGIELANEKRKWVLDCHSDYLRSPYATHFVMMWTQDNDWITKYCVQNQQTGSGKLSCLSLLSGGYLLSNKCTHKTHALRHNHILGYAAD